MDISEISKYVQRGRCKTVKTLVNQALEENMDVKIILNEGLIHGMGIIGEKFKRNEIFLPEVLIASKAMNSGMEILEPILSKTGVKPIGKAVVGTVKGDIHDIGKNLVKMMLKGTGIQVIDLGTDVSSNMFIDKAKEINADIICMSALLTTTMPSMKVVIDDLKELDLRNNFKIMIGGAPVTQEYAKIIGADFYTSDAATAAETAKNIILNNF
ncbi:cobalamin-dependent protein [Clostridium rectalis]|uniref:cobalamin-dependent protein n=1 Tax=Clostridium rectalis TaxID=2040295 RepID=UPI000F62ED00